MKIFEDKDTLSVGFKEFILLILKVLFLLGQLVIK